MEEGTAAKSATSKGQNVEDLLFLFARKQSPAAQKECGGKSCASLSFEKKSLGSSHRNSPFLQITSIQNPDNAESQLVLPSSLKLP